MWSWPLATEHSARVTQIVPSSNDPISSSVVLSLFPYHIFVSFSVLKCCMTTPLCQVTGPHSGIIRAVLGAERPYPGTRSIHALSPESGALWDEAPVAIVLCCTSIKPIFLKRDTGERPFHQIHSTFRLTYAATILM